MTDQLCDLLQWSSSDFNQTGSQSILSRPVPQHTVHQSMSCQYGIRTAWSVIFFPSHCEHFDNLFTAEIVLFVSHAQTERRELCETSQCQMFNFHNNRIFTSFLCLYNGRGQRHYVFQVGRTSVHPVLMSVIFQECLVGIFIKFGTCRNKQINSSHTAEHQCACC